MKEIIFSLIIFVLIYLVYLLTVVLKTKKLDKFWNGMEINYLKRKYNLSLKNTNKRKLANIVALTNSFIITITVYLIISIDNYILKLMIAFIILMPLIIVAYHIIGTFLKKKEV